MWPSRAVANDLNLWSVPGCAALLLDDPVPWLPVCKIVNSGTNLFLQYFEMCLMKRTMYDLVVEFVKFALKSCPRGFWGSDIFRTFSYV